MGNVYPKGVLHHIGFGFGAVNSVIFLFSQELNTMQLTSQNHIIIIEKPKYSYKKKNERKQFNYKEILNLSVKSIPFQITKDPNEKSKKNP